MNAKPESFVMQLWHWALCGLILAASLDDSCAATQTTNAPSPSRSNRVDYSSFKLVTDRNIFSPTRSGSRPMRYETRANRTGSARTESFSLVGTMEYEHGQFAFFDGSSSSFRKTLKLNDTIAGYKIAAVGYNYVKLAQATNTLELKVGGVMRHDGNGDWVPISANETSIGNYRQYAEAPPPAPDASKPEAASTTTEPLPAGDAGPQVIVVADGEAVAIDTSGAMPPPPGASSPAPTTATAPAAGGENDVLRRLMQRREQELNR